MVSLSRAGTAVLWSLFVSFLLSSFGPPDVITQVAFVPVLFVVALPGAYVVIGRNSSRREHALFAVVLGVLSALGMSALDAATGGMLLLRVVWLAVALVVAGWFAYVEGEGVLDAVSG